MLPVKALEWLVIVGVSKLRCVKSVYEAHLFEVFVEHPILVFSRPCRNNTTIIFSRTMAIVLKMTAIMAFHDQIVRDVFNVPNVQD